MGTGERSMKILLLGLALLPGSAWAQSSVGVVDTGDTAWLLTATALVSFMSLPGLALFYGGLVRAKNVLSVLVQCFAIRSEEHTYELQSLMRNSYDGFCLKKKNTKNEMTTRTDVREPH